MQEEGDTAAMSLSCRQMEWSSAVVVTHPHVMSQQLQTKLSKHDSCNQCCQHKAAANQAVRTRQLLTKMSRQDSCKQSCPDKAAANKAVKTRQLKKLSEQGSCKQTRQDKAAANKSVKASQLQKKRLRKGLLFSVKCIVDKNDGLTAVYQWIGKKWIMWSQLETGSYIVY